MQNTDYEQDTGRPIGLMILVGALAIIGAFTLFGWVIGLVGFVFKIAVLALVVFAVVTAVRVLSRR
jgi:hypothetical protein